jgi:hypothetical protein
VSEIQTTGLKDVLQRARERRIAGARLCQTAYHNRALALYAKLGFNTCEPLSVLQGEAIEQEISGYAVSSVGVRKARGYF